MPSIEFLLQVGLNHYLALAALLFSFGMIAVLMRKNVIVMMMGIELMLNAVNLTFIAFSAYSNHLNGQIMVFFVMTIAAAEAAVGLALVVMIYKNFKQVDIKFFEQLRG
jgi:NADH-quinone oxidoreductase subunit K